MLQGSRDAGLRRKEWEQRQQAGRAPGDLSLSIPTLSGPRSHCLGCEPCCGLSKGTEQGCGMQLGTQLSPGPSMSPGGRVPLLPAQPSRSSAFLGPRTPSHSPSAPTGTKKERDCVSLPIVPIYSPKCWQDGCDLVPRFSSSSAPSHTMLPLGPFNPPLFPFPLLPLAQPSSTPSTLLPTAHPHPTAHPMAPALPGLWHQRELGLRLWERGEQDHPRTGKTLSAHPGSATALGYGTVGLGVTEGPGCGDSVWLCSVGTSRYFALLLGQS